MHCGNELPVNVTSFVCDSCVASLKAQDTSKHSLLIQEKTPNFNLPEYKHGKHAPDVYTKMELGEVDLTRMTNNQPTTSIHPNGDLPGRKASLAEIPLPKHLRPVPEKRTPLTLEEMTKGQPQDYVDVIKALIAKYPNTKDLDSRVFNKPLPYGASFDQTTGTYTFTGEPLLYEDFVGEHITTRIATEINFSLTKPDLDKPLPDHNSWDSKTSLYRKDEEGNETPLVVKGIYADENGNIIFGENLTEKDRENLPPYLGTLPRGTPYIMRIVCTLKTGVNNNTFFGAYSNEDNLDKDYLKRVQSNMHTYYWHNYVPRLGKSLNKHSHPVGEILLRKE
jgi:hypothetical protein